MRWVKPEIWFICLPKYALALQNQPQSDTYGRRIKALISAGCIQVCGNTCLARMMSNFTSIGFHVPYKVDAGGKPKSDAVDGAVAGSFLTSSGFSPKVVMFVVSAGAKDLNLLNKATADRLGIAVTFTTPAQRQRAYTAYSEGLEASRGAAPGMGAAAQLYRQSAVLGFAGAQNNLGDLYETGRGVAKSDKAAIYWYTRAAERGEPTAYLSLAHALSEGIADTDVLVEALKFAALAFNFLPAGKNKGEAESLSKQINAKLSEADSKRVLELVGRWVPLYREERLLGDATR
jgi:Sel1 repeat